MSKPWPPEGYERKAPPNFRSRLADLVTFLGWDAERLAVRFEISIPSARRWLSGRSEPHPLIAAAVLRDLEKWAEKKEESV